MLFKLIGSIIVLASTSFLGYVLSRDCSKRPQQLRELQGLLQIFENEVSFLSNLLVDAFKKIYSLSKSDAAIFFKRTVQLLEMNNGFSSVEAWEAAVKECIKGTALNKEDEAILASFGKMLGNSDLEGQIKNIRLTLNQLKLQEQKAEATKTKNEAMYKRLGVLAGIAIVIVLI